MHEKICALGPFRAWISKREVVGTGGLPDCLKLEPTGPVCRA